MSDQWWKFDFHASYPQRLDTFLVENLPDYSRSRLQMYIKEGLVLVNNRPARKAGQMIEAPSHIEIKIPPPAPGKFEPEQIPLNIIYEDGNVLVINKPAGMVVHPGAGHANGTLVHAALAHAPDISGVGGDMRPGIVHRLDKDTSGIILIAKNDRTHRYLQEQFHDRQVEKIYLALVDGHPPTSSGRIEAAIGRDNKDRKRMKVLPDGIGRPAISIYKVQRIYQKHALLEVHPLSGRTHQVRVHLTFLGCPIVADTVYGHKHPSLPLGRHFLHAAKLTVNLPGHSSPSSFEAPLAPDLQKVLDVLENR